MEYLGSSWTDFHEIDILIIDILGFLENPSKKFKVSLKSDKNDGYFT
jgi:nucleoside-triphosphatase THEP1